MTEPAERPTVLAHPALAPTTAGRPRAPNTDPNSDLHPRVVQARVREHLAVTMRAQCYGWDDIAASLGLQDRHGAIEACRRGLAALQRLTEHEVEMLHMQVEQIISDVRTREIDDKQASVMLRGLALLAKLKGFEPGGNPVTVQHQHQHAHAVVQNALEWQRLLGEVAQREIERRTLVAPVRDADDAESPALPPSV